MFTECHQVNVIDIPQTERSETLLQSRLKHVSYIQTFDAFELLAALDMLETDFKRQVNVFSLAV